MMAARTRTADPAYRVRYHGRSVRLPSTPPDRAAWRIRRPALQPALAAVSAAVANLTRLHRIAKRKGDRWEAQGEALAQLSGGVVTLKRLARARWLDAARALAEGLAGDAGGLVRALAEDAEERTPFTDDPRRYAVTWQTIPRRPVMLAGAMDCRRCFLELVDVLSAVHDTERRQHDRK